MDFNPDQFDRQPGRGQNSFDGYGNNALRLGGYRVRRPTPDPTPEPAPQPTGWTQPTLPDPPANQPTGNVPLTNAARARADIAAARAQTRAAQVATAQARAAAAGHRQTLAEARAAQLGQRAAAATAPPPGPRTVDPASVPDNTPPVGPGRSGPLREPVQINQTAFRNTGLRFGPEPPEGEPAPSAVPPRPTSTPAPAGPPSSTPPSRLNTPPGNPWVQNRAGSAVTAAARSGAITRAPAPAPAPPRPISPGVARAGRAAAVGTFLAARALQSINKTATDPKRSGQPLYRTRQGWMHS